jgi:O-succinylbenzoic acid--CoA ligase
MNWQTLCDSDTAWLLSPRLPARDKRLVALLQQRLPQPKHTFWLLSSGTTQVHRIKALALPHESILVAAQGANEHLQSTYSDRWLLAIPSYHIGGLAIFARASLSGAQVLIYADSWNAANFVEQILQKHITLTSLVPTQVHDLVAAHLSSPPSLRAVIVGGGALAHDLYQKARTLGWPLLPSYGLTECASQVATAALDSLQRNAYPPLSILPHVQVQLREQILHLRSKALVRWVAYADTQGTVSLEDPLRDGWFRTEDRAKWDNGFLQILGRRDDIVKILGVLVSVHEVETQFRNFVNQQNLTGEVCILAIPVARAGHQLVLITDTKDSLRDWEAQIQRFNAALEGPKRIQNWCWMAQIPRNEMGKIARARLAQSLELI